MAYFMINGIDYSMYVNKLSIKRVKLYNSQTNANGNTVVDLISTKRQIEVGIIPLNAEVMMQLQNAIDGFNILVSYRDPLTNELVNDINCIIPENGVEYYTIQADKVLFKEFTLSIQEL
jgi:hypothetical protein